jgi:hypothetical protein
MEGVRMDKWLYGYWFKSKKKTFGWGWTIMPNTFPGYVTWVFGIVCSLLLVTPEILSIFPEQEVTIVSGTVFAAIALITFLKTDLRDDP